MDKVVDVYEVAADFVVDRCCCRFKFKIELVGKIGSAYKKRNK